MNAKSTLHNVRSLLAIAMLASLSLFATPSPSLADCTVSGLMDEDDHSCRESWEKKWKRSGFYRTGKWVGDRYDDVKGRIEMYRMKKEWAERDARLAVEAEERKTREWEREKWARRLDVEYDKLEKSCDAARYSCGSDTRDKIDSYKRERGEKYFPYVPPAREAAPPPKNEFESTPTASPLGGAPRQPGGIKLDARPKGAQADLSAERERILKLAR